MRIQRESQRGAALVVSLITVMVVASLGAGLIQLQTILDKKHAFSIDRRRALYIAEAGLAEATVAVSQGKSGMIATEALPAAYGGGVFWVESIDLPEDRLALVCTARIGTAEFVLRTLVLPNLNPVASLGFFGTQGVEIGWGTVIDGYHSGEGDFAAQLDLTEPVPTTGDFAKVGSNADIVLDEGESGEVSDPGGETLAEGGGETSTPEESTGGWTLDPPLTGDGFSWSEVLDGSSDPGGDTAWNTGDSSTADPGSDTTPLLTAPSGEPTRIYGRLSPGIDGVVRSSGFSVIEGRIKKYLQVPALPAVTLPPCTETIQGDLLITGAQTGVGASVDTLITGSLVVREGGTLTLVGPKVLDVDMLHLAADASLEFDDSLGPIQIYARRGVWCGEGTSFESLASEPSARGTSIFVSQYSVDGLERVTLPPSGTFRGVLYAPSDAVVVPTSLRWFGSIVARSLRTEPGARITYDSRFSVGGDGVPALPRILSWQIVPVGDGLARRLSVDPVFALQLQGIVPIVPSQAAPETDCEVQYVETSGAAAMHVGTFASLNLTQVSRIVGVRWIDVRDGMPRAWLRPSGQDPTGAIETDRFVMELLRETIVILGGETKVGTLDNAQVVEMISKVPTSKLSLQPQEVSDANARNSSQVDMSKYVDFTNNVTWDLLFDDVSTRKEIPGDTSIEATVAPGG